MTANGGVTISRAPDGATRSVTPDAAASADKVEFRFGAMADAVIALLQPDPTLGMMAGTPDMSRNIADNPLAYDDRLVVNDTGASGYTLQYRFKVSNPTASLGLRRLRDWAAQDSSPSAAFRNGRYSVKDKFLPVNDLTAGAEAGYQIQGLNISADYQNRQVIGTLTLRLAGEPSEVGP